jgi:hypothetical protein
VEDLAAYAVDRMFADLAPRDVERRRRGEMDRADITRLGLGELLAQVAEQSDILKHLSPGGFHGIVRERLTDLMARHLRETLLSERQDAGEQFLRLGGQYIAGGVVRVFLDWLDEPGGLDEAQVIDIVFDLLPAWLTRDEPLRPQG